MSSGRLGEAAGWLLMHALWGFVRRHQSRACCQAFCGCKPFV